MKNLFVYLKGILLGFIGLAVPGLSASTIAIEVGIYYELIDKLSNIIKKFKTSIIFVIFIMLGYFTGGAIGAVSVKLLFNNFPLLATLLIIGFILGGIPNMVLDLNEGKKKISCYISLIITLALLVVFSFFLAPISQVEIIEINIKELIVLFFVGVFTSSTLIIPGVDFAVLLLSIGYYEELITAISDLLMLKNVLNDVIILGIYLVGYGIGSVLLSKIIKKLIENFSDQAKYVSFAFVIAAPFVVMKHTLFDNPLYSFNYPELIIGIVLGIIAFLLMFFIMRYFRKKENNKDKEVENV